MHMGQAGSLSYPIAWSVSTAPATPIPDPNRTPEFWEMTLPQISEIRTTHLEAFEKRETNPNAGMRPRNGQIGG